MMLVLEIEYLVGVAYAAVSADSDEPDWPPQPDRIFSAMVATWALRGASAAEEAALRWLEALPTPQLLASRAAPRTAHVHFVPPNDPSSRQLKHARHVMPQLRHRQPRRFPAARPHDPVVRLFWPHDEPDDGTLAALQALAGDTAYIGHSASLTRCRFLRSEDPAPPADAEPSRRGVYPGRFAELRAAFASGRRPSPGDWIPPAPRAPLPVPESIFAGRWLLLEQVDGGEMPDVRAAAIVAKAVRDRLVEGYRAIGLGERVPEVVSGRGPDGGPARSPHLAIVPLAFTGFPHADGHLLGLGIVPPRGSAILDDPDFLRALRAVAPADPAQERRVLWLHLPAPQALRVCLAPTADASRRSLDPALYTGLHGAPARSFATVTPIALDRHPKERGEARREEIVRQIVAACRNIGLPEPATLMTNEGSRPAVFLTGHSAVEGAPPAAPSGKAPGWMRWRLPAPLAGRALTHAVIRFAAPVHGPVILGAGRFLGMGLCRPIRGPEGAA